MAAMVDEDYGTTPDQDVLRKKRINVLQTIVGEHEGSEGPDFTDLYDSEDELKGLNSMNDIVSPLLAVENGETSSNGGDGYETSDCLAESENESPSSSSAYKISSDDNARPVSPKRKKQKKISKKSRKRPRASSKSHKKTRPKSEKRMRRKEKHRKKKSPSSLKKKKRKEKREKSDRQKTREDFDSRRVKKLYVTDDESDMESLRRNGRQGSTDCSPFVKTFIEQSVRDRINERIDDGIITEKQGRLICHKATTKILACKKRWNVDKASKLLESQDSIMRFVERCIDYYTRF